MAKAKKAPEAPIEAKAPIEAPARSSGAVWTKIDPKDVIQLQKDGRLMGYDPETGMGLVREKGLPTIWPDA